MSRAAKFPDLIFVLRRMKPDDHTLFPYKSKDDVEGLRKCMTNIGLQELMKFKSIVSDKYLHIVRIR